MRFAIAGETPVHIPEVVYSWRVHSESTARDVGNQSYIHSSQKRVLQRFVDSRIEPGRYAVTESPFFPGGAHFRIMKSSPGEHPILVFTLTDPAARASALLSIAQQASEEHAWILFQQAGLKVRYQDWLAESETLFELHPDAVMAGGLIVDPAGRVAEEAWYFGAEGACAGPYVGRRAESPGYFGELHKRRSASAVSMRCTVMRSGFLEETLRNIPGRATIGFFGAWAGAYAKRTGRRIIYSPFLGGVSTPNWSFKADAVEERLFCDLNRDVIPDTRYYSGQRSLQNPYAIA
jgi:hypothetical protein